MNIKRDFQLFAKDHKVSSLLLHDYQKIQANYINPTIIEERQLNVAQMDVFSRLMMDRIIFLGTPIDDGVGNIITAQMLYLNSVEKDKSIGLYINSPGGSVNAGLAIYDTMHFIDSPVNTTVAGMAASMGFVLAVAGKKRYALRHSRLMQHQPSGGFQGTSADMEINTKQIIILRDELYNIISEKTGHSYDKIKADCDRDYWMTAAEAKEYGAIDEVITKKVI